MTELVRQVVQNPVVSLIAMLAAIGVVQSMILLATIIVLRQVRRQIWAMRNLRQSWRESTQSAHLEVLQMVLRLLEQGKPALETNAEQRAFSPSVTPLTRERSRAQ